MRQGKRDLLLETASRLFNLHGYQATGIDLIIKESGISKATLYKYFKTKEVLILEVLKFRHDRFMGSIDQTILDEGELDEPALVIFDIYTEWFQQNDFNGCFFNKAGGEFSQIQSPINQFVFNVKTDIKNLLTKYLHHTKRDIKNAEDAAANLMLLLDGAIIDAHISRNKGAAKRAKNLASKILSYS